MRTFTAIHKLLLAATAVVALPAAGLCDNFAAQMGAGYAGLRLSLDEQSIRMITLEGQTSAAHLGIAAVTESYIEAQQVAKRLAERNQELQKQFAALGVSRVTEDKAVLEERLLHAVRDLDMVDQKYKAAVQQLDNLLTATKAYLGAKENMKRDMLPALMRAVSESDRLLLQDVNSTVQGNAQTGTVGQMRVLDVKNDLALVIINAGTRQGVSEGMQFIVKQGDRRVGAVRALDVRDNITGCVIQTFESANTPMEVGQQVILDVRS
jgi:hypothetical protein